MSKYGVAWKNYSKNMSRLGARSVFPNPDVFPDKSFITSGVWEMWHKPAKKLKRKSKKPKSKLGIRRQEEDEALRGAFGEDYESIMKRYRRK